MVEPISGPASFLDGPRRVIATLVQGFAILNRRLWVLVVPIGLDLFLWLGPRIVPRQLAESALAALSAEAPTTSALATILGSQQLDPTLLRDLGERTNLFHLLSAPLVPVPLLSFSIPLNPLLLPNLTDPAWPGFTPQSWAPPPGLVVLLPLVILVLGLLLGTLYQLPLADLVRGSNEGGMTMLRRVPRAWWRMTVLAALGLLISGAFLLLGTAMVETASVLSPFLGGVFVYALMALVLFALLFLYFAPQAVLLSWVQPLRGVFYSVRVVRHSFWSSLGFMLLVWLVRVGTVSLWQYVSVHPLGLLLAILANAYITAGLATATLVFYRSRLREWLAAAEAGQKGGKVVS